MFGLVRNKRMITVVLSVILTLATIVPVAAAQGNPFNDVKKSDWFYDGVQYAYEHNLVVGTGASKFSPKGDVTRAMMVMVLYNGEGKPASGKAPFSDVADGQWYTPAVAWAAATKVVNGYTDGTFKPNTKITREQVATILYNYAAYRGIDTSKRADLSRYSDASSIGGYAKTPMSWANANKLINGTSNTTLSPKSTASRAQLATILMNFGTMFKADPGPGPGPAPVPWETKYTVTFNMGGTGAQVAPQTITPGGKITRPADLQSADGAVFRGWHTKQYEKSEWDFDNMTVSSNMTLYAHWCYPDKLCAASLETEGGTTLYIYYDYGKGAPEGSTPLGSLPQSASSSRDWPWNDFCNTYSNVIIDASVENYNLLQSTAGMFQRFSYVKSISGLQYLIMDNVQSMSSMFEACGVNRLEGIANWNTQNVINMDKLFDDISGAESAPDVSNWNVSKVTNMKYMFAGYGHASTTLDAFPDLSKWNTSSLKEIGGMFQWYGDCSAKMNGKLLDLSSFNTLNVEDIRPNDTLFVLSGDTVYPSFSVRFGKGWTIPMNKVFDENDFPGFDYGTGITNPGTGRDPDMNYLISDLKPGETITFKALYN